MPEAAVKSAPRLSLVWLIPLIAVVVGGWLAFKTLSERGPTVVIEFKTASGLSSGQTKVKFKDVEVGQVTAIDVGPDLKTVLVTAELKHGFAEHLSENTRFWVERPRVSASGVSGLDTLLSGAYIAMDPGDQGRDQRRFEGLEEPPLFTTAEPGRQFVLRSPTLGSLNIGSPVYYRQIQVGQVVGYALDDDGQAVSIEVFVSAPHDALVSGNTRFWNASGIDFSMSGSGFSLDTQSLLSVVVGGIGFDTPETIDSGDGGRTLPETFPLYPTREAAHAKTYSRKERYLLFFEGSVRGLAIGAPVLLKGIDIGKVLDIQLQYSIEDSEFQIPVLIEVEPDRIAIRGDAASLEGVNLIERLVSSGLRGQLKFESLLTGGLYVDLDIYPDAGPGVVGTYGDYDLIPTIPTPLEALTTKVTHILDKIDAIPLDRIGRDLGTTVAGASALLNSGELEQTLGALRATLEQVRGTVEQLNHSIAPELARTLEEGSRALEKAGSMLSTSSPFQADLQRMFQDVSSAARAVRLLADYLERHPEALLKGKGR
ncbi:Paraquat-inducible protein B [Imhoffiella purpurea]|uniref:Paraquat-inducible protein B n=1 Tax=Imhoffiella purpurea TaxID=1249627 RepID=W9V254_9GAMM|nr:Paraquat-inducible protein B [Imhoffiella purpurea]